MSQRLLNRWYAPCRSCRGRAIARECKLCNKPTLRRCTEKESPQKSLRRAAKYKLSLLRSPRPHARAAIPSPSSSLRCPLSIIGALVSRKFGEMRARGACTRVRSHSKRCMHLNFALRDSNASNVWLRDLGRGCDSCTRRNRPYRRARGVAEGFDVRNV